MIIAFVTNECISSSRR